MNWEAIGAIAEGLGAAGVIASLLYVANQVRANTRASRVEAKLQSTRFLGEMVDMLIQDPALNELFRKGRADLEALEGPDFYRFSNMLLKAFWFFSAQHFQFRLGTLAESEWEEVNAPIHYYLSGPGVQAWWSSLGRASFGPEFRDFIDAEIAEMEARE